MSRAPGLELNELTVRFGDTPVLESISLSIGNGERVALLGASGSGKTTLLRAIAGLIDPLRGEIRAGGRDVRPLPVGRRGIGYLRQTPLLFPHLSVRENVAFPLRVRKIDTNAVTEKVDEMLRRVRIDPLGDRHPETLSGGQKHRVALARALIADPSVILLDEPLASLDPSLRADVREEILEIQRASGVAMLFVTHDLEEAARVGERVAVLIGGRLAQVDPPARLFGRPASLDVARFVGLGAEIRGEVRNGRFESTALSLDVLDDLSNGPTVLVVGSAGVRICPADAVVSDAGGGNAGTDALLRSGTVQDIVHTPHGDRATVEVDGDVLEGIVEYGRSPARTGDPVSVRIDRSALRFYPVDG